jgi:hypothetical protein
MIQLDDEDGSRRRRNTALPQKKKQITCPVGKKKQQRDSRLSHPVACIANRPTQRFLFYERSIWHPSLQILRV